VAALPYSQSIKRASGSEPLSTPGGTRTRSFRIESPASFPFDHGGVQRFDKLRRQGSNLRFAINSRASYRSTTPDREAETAGFEPARRQATCALAARCLSKSAMPPSGRRGSRTPKAEAHPRAKWQSFRKVTPAGLEPARRRLRVGRSTELSYGARDVVGRDRTCNAPRFRRALYLF
jgi:hypothetical protein